MNDYDFSEWDLPDSPEPAGYDFSEWEIDPEKKVEAKPFVPPPARKEKVSAVDSAAAGGSKGITLGFDDEIIGTARALWDTVKPGGSKWRDFNEVYRDRRDEVRRYDKRAAEDNPISYGAGTIAGAIPASVAGAATLPARLGVSATKKFLPNAARFGAQGAAGGAAMGLGETAEFKDVGQVAVDVGKGAGLGAVGGVGGAAAGRMLTGIPGAVKEKMSSWSNYLGMQAGGFKIPEINRVGGDPEKVKASIAAVRDMDMMIADIDGKLADAGKVIQWNRSTEEMAEGVKQNMTQVYKEYDGIMARISKNDPEKMKSIVDLDPVIAELAAKKSSLGINATVNSPQMKLIDKQIEAVKGMAVKSSGSAVGYSGSGVAKTATSYSTDLATLKKFKSDVSGKAYAKGGATPNDTANAKVYQGINNSLSTQRKSAIAKLSPSDAKLWLEADKKLQHLKNMEVGLGKKLIREGSQVPGGILEGQVLSSGSTGGFAGALANLPAAVAARIFKTSGPQLVGGAMHRFAPSQGVVDAASNAATSGLNRFGTAAPAYYNLDPTVAEPKPVNRFDNPKYLER